MDIKKALSNTALFYGVDINVLEYFATHSQRQTYTKKQELFAAGDEADCFFFVIEGWIKLYRLSRDGEETIINIIAPGETFAEAAVFGEKQRYPVAAQAIEDTTILKIPRKLFVERIQKDNDFALRILGSISGRQRYLVKQIEQITVKSAPQRIGAFLLHLGRNKANDDTITVDLPYDKSLIAARLNIQPETFSRALGKLKIYGVTTKGRTVFIKDSKNLAQFCDVNESTSVC